MVDITRVQSHVCLAVPRGDIVPQVGSNVGLVRTREGVVLIDTTISEARMQMILDASGVQADEVCLIILTHLHADHLGGLSLFRCPVICHRRAGRKLAGKCSKPGQSLSTFDEELEKEIGGVKLRLVHAGGHTPESIFAWLPAEKVLFSGDLIFAGRAPFLAGGTSLQKLVKALRCLKEMDAKVILPGHGQPCGVKEINSQIHYIQTTWAIVKEHVGQGHPLAEIRLDARLPVPKTPGRNFERNIEWMYRKMVQK
jgi:cyclase